MTMDRVERNGLQVDAGLARFLEDDALPGTGVTEDAFWQAFADGRYSVNPFVLNPIDRLTGTCYIRRVRGL